MGAMVRGLLLVVTMSPFKHILVPTDFGEPAQHALDMAVSLAEKFDAEITLMHAVWVPTSMYPYSDALYVAPIDEWTGAARRALDSAVADLRRRYPRSTGVVVTDDPAPAILAMAKKRHADLIVMGTHGRRGLSRVFLGSVAEKTVRLADIPVLTVGGPGDAKAKTRALAESSAP
jgi:nucleotide-binding universal stress UspA family protein